MCQYNLSTKAKMLLTIHDELLFEVEQDVAKQTGEVVKKVMKSASLPAVQLSVQLSVPLTVDVGKDASWGEAH